MGLEQLKIRSALTCESKRGICAKCYGRNLATGLPVKLGEAVGIIAAQSIGEPGTQLTMRTFHVGGTASQTFKQPIIKAKNEGIVRFNDLKVVESTDSNFVVLNKNGTVSVHARDGRELESYNIVIGSVISIADGGVVKKGETFIQWDPYNVPIITEKAGRIEFRDMIQGVTIRKEVDEATGVMGTVVIEHKEDLHPQIVIVGEKKEVFASYSIPAGAHIEVKEAQKVPAGTRLARTPRKIAKTKDITGGLPRVAELFEARRPKDAAEIAKIDGVVDIGGTVRGKRRVIVQTQTPAPRRNTSSPSPSTSLSSRAISSRKASSSQRGRSFHTRCSMSVGRRSSRNTCSTKFRKSIACRVSKLMTSTSRSSCDRCFGK